MGRSSYFTIALLNGFPETITVISQDKLCEHVERLLSEKNYLSEFINLNLLLSNLSRAYNN